MSLRAPSRRAQASYDSPLAYAELIEPRYAPIADALVEAAAPSTGDDVLELGAGTGLVTRRYAGGVRSIVATDLAHGMLEVGRASLDAQAVFALVDYAAPLPFLDASFDLVLSGLTFVQEQHAPLREVARVLRPGGRIAFTMWGRTYHELCLLDDAGRSIGRPPLPTPRPDLAARRLRRAGFVDVELRTFDLQNRFDNVDDYLEYRRGFGTPTGVGRTVHRRYLTAVARRARLDAAPDGSLTLGWTLATITAGLRG